MDSNKQVLLVTNAITNDEIAQIKQSLTNEKASKLGIKLSLVHVIPRLPTCYFNIPSVGVLIEKYYREAKASLNETGKVLGVAKRDQWLISGKIRTDVLRLANKLNSKFVLASREQIEELQRSLFFNDIQRYAFVRSISQLKTFDDSAG